MTKKLYDIDSHISSFKSTVIRCEQIDDGFRTVLSETAFFPEGGGQPADRGTINGAEVFNVLEQNGEIFHYTKSAFNVGDEVECLLDWETRYDRMQNHSGEHIISGIVHRLYGYENVGFHLSDETVTLDFDGYLTEQQLSLVEREANEVIWKNSALKCYYPTENQLNSLSYRSKKEIEGAVRIVEIEDCDVCACCAPHVNSAGEIGIIKMLDTERLRGGIRIYIKCGLRALADYGEKYKSLFALSNLMSVKQHEAVMGVNKLYSQIGELKSENLALKKRLIDAVVRNSADANAVFEQGLDVKELQLLADALFRVYGGIRAAFSKNTADSLSFAICGNEEELQSFFVGFKSEFSVRGGGRNGMVQGTVSATVEDIKEYFKKH